MASFVKSCGVSIIVRSIYLGAGNDVPTELNAFYIYKLDFHFGFSSSLVYIYDVVLLSGRMSVTFCFLCVGVLNSGGFLHSKRSTHPHCNGVEAEILVTDIKKRTCFYNLGEN